MQQKIYLFCSQNLAAMKKIWFLPLIVFVLFLHSCAEQEGCIDINACNFSLDAVVDDGSCYSPGDDCDDGDENTSYDVYGNNCQCEGVTPGVSGCISDDACNYNADATDDDGSCYYPGDPCDDGDSSTTNDAYNSNCDCVGESTGSAGCTNSGACNYDPNATDDDGSCYYPGSPCDDGDSSTTNDAYNANCDCVGNPPTDSGCAVNADGFISVTFGVMTDEWSEECSYRIFATGDETVTTDWISATTDDVVNSTSWGLSTGNWTMEVNDTYGDGKTDNGYYFAECQTTTGATEVLFTTDFTDGFESQTSFELTNGIIGPPFVDENN